jgi:hypothetical protein
MWWFVDGPLDFDLELGLLVVRHDHHERGGILNHRGTSDFDYGYD